MAEGGDVSQNTVYIRNKDLPSNLDGEVTAYDLCETINDALGTEVGVRCIQREGEIWRVDLKSEEDCQELEEEGIKVKEPFPKGVRIQTPTGMEKILICGLPYSVKDKDIVDMLKQCSIDPPTDLKTSTEDICDCDTNKNTLVSNGNRIVIIPTFNTYLPRNIKCAGSKCRLYHSGQKPRTSQVPCYREVCRVCLQPNYNNHNENVIILPPLFWTEVYRSCRKAIQNETKKEGKELMKLILLKIFEKSPEYRKIVESLTKCTVIAEANEDRHWGTGLNQKDTIHTDESEWPGKNVLGSLVKENALSNVTKLTFYTLNVNGLNSGNRMERLYKWLKEQRFDIVLLQETHLTKKKECKQSDLFKEYARYSDSTGKKGVSILVNKSSPNFEDIEVRELNSESEHDTLKNGGKSHVTVTYKGETFYLINVYVPHSGKIDEKKQFLINLSNYIEDKCKDNLDNIILAGDFNCHRDNQDKPKDTGDLILENIIEKFSLMDAWTTTRSGKKSKEGNTYISKISGDPVTRIDYVFFTEKLSFPLFDISIRKPLVSTDSDEESSERFSDHEGLYFELNTSKVDQ